MKTNKTLLILGTAVAAASLAGCQQDPFPQGHLLVDSKPTETVIKNYTLDVTPVMNFTECEDAEYTFRAVVPAPATSIVTVSNLPDGAVFDPEELRLTWTPPTFSSGSPDGAVDSEQAYQINVSLQASNDPATVVQRTAVLIVKPNGKRQFTFNRLNWQQRVVQTIAFKNQVSYSIPLKFASIFHFPVIVTVSPALMRNEVTYDSTQGVLTIIPKHYGTRTFALTGSAKGENEVEYFTIDVPKPPNSDDVENLDPL